MMEPLIFAVILIAVVAGIAYAKVPAFKAKVDGLRGIRQEAKPEDTSPVVSPAVQDLPKPQPLEDYFATLPPSTRAFIPTGKLAEYFDGLVEQAKQGPAVDRSGFQLKAENGYLVHPEVISGLTYEFTFPPVGKTLRIFGVGGDQLTRINYETMSQAAIQAPESGILHLMVEGVGRGGKIRVGVQLVP